MQILEAGAVAYWDAVSDLPLPDAIGAMRLLAEDVPWLSAAEGGGRS
jgi:hypothetical protein